MDKRIVLSLCILLFLPLSLCAQVSVLMERDGGVYKVPCSINGLKMKFVFDTGASAVSLSESMAEYMFDNGYLSKTDITGNGQVQIADGSVVNVKVVNIRDFEIGDIHIKDVAATIKAGQNVPLLMGQSAIEKLGRISIEKNRLIIHQHTVNMTDAEIAKIREEIERNFSSSIHEVVVSKSQQLKEAIDLEQWDYYYYIMSLLQCHRFEETVLVCNDWEASGVESCDYVSSNNYISKGDAYRVLGKIREAMQAYEKSLMYENEEMAGYIYESIADCYFDFNDKTNMEKYLKKGLSSRYNYLGLSLADVLANKVSDYILAGLYFRYALFEEQFTRDNFQKQYYIKLSAKCGSEIAIDLCFKEGINYQK